jgi:hypothetical protein
MLSPHLPPLHPLLLLPPPLLLLLHLLLLLLVPLSVCSAASTPHVRPNWAQQ